MKFVPTMQQQDALDAKGGVLVSAAAGSGKTAVLVERVANTVLDEDLQVAADRYLIATFTIAAASEMKSRIAESISEKIAQNPSNRWYAHQKFLLNKAPFGTIDSFCSGLVREYFYKLDVQPDFSISGNMGDAEDRVLGEIVNERIVDPEFLKLCSLFDSEYAINSLCKTVKETYKYLVTLPNYLSILDDYRQMYSQFDINTSVWTKTVLDEVKAQIEHLYNAVSKIEDEVKQTDFYEKYGEVFDNRFDAINGLYKAVCEYDWQAAFEYINGYIPVPRKGKISTEAPELYAYANRLCGLITDKFKPLKELVTMSESDIYDDIKKLKPSLELLFDIIAEFDKRLFAEKSRLNTYDFADVEQLAFRLLVDENGEQTSIAKELSQKYYEVMVDEFQDTNSLQCAIFNAVSDNGKKLFCVGDVKQSIYTFRRANPNIFLRMKNTLPNYDRNNPEPQNCKVIMSGNFRSEPNICNFVNFLFERIMSQRAGQMDYVSEDMLEANVEPIEFDRANVQLNIIDNSKKTESEYDPEVRFIVDYIKKNVGHTQIGSGDNRRAAGYGDIAVMFRQNSRLLRLCNALDDAGIPYYCRKGNKYFDCREIKCALSLLCVIDNPRNDFELLNLLSSELFGFSANELAELKILDKQADLYSLLNIAAAKNKKCANVIEKIAKYRTAAAQQPLCDLLYDVFDDSGLMNVAAAISGRQAQQNLRKLCAMAADFEKMYITGLSGFVKYILRLKAANTEEAEPPAEGTDAVMVMTIHASKGLQFPICIVGALEHSIDNKTKNIGGNNDLRVFQSEKCGIGLKIVDTENYIKYETLPCIAVMNEQSRETLSEEIRLLYVALTRAKEQLVMCAKFNKSVGNYFAKVANGIDAAGGVKAYAAECKSLIDMIAAASLEHPDCENLRRISVGDEAENDDMGKKYAVNIIKSADIPDIEPYCAGDLPNYDADAVERLAERIDYRYAYEKINAVAAKQAASRLAHQNEYANYSCTAVPLFLQGKKLTAAQRGTALHKLMQYIDLKAAASDTDRELERIKNMRLLSADEIESVDKSAVARFAASPLGKRMMNANEIYHEREFMVELAATELDDTLGCEFADETVVVQGAVDCVFFEGDKMVIVDYKTDRVKDISELREKYEVQLKVYQKALNQVFGEHETELVIYSFWLSDQIEL